MKKLTLDLDMLAVESFAPGHGVSFRGTVRGNDITQNCGGTAYCTLGSSCDGSCYASCGDPDCGSYYCEDTSLCGNTGDTSCAQPCNYTCDGSTSCDANNTCIQTCAGYGTC